ncbi:MAG TPA: undecaprenyl-diphosphate phosphatase [Chitinophagaceae bacterium]|nr:undecaprenyl-diphosphate phosphatase [Chitinophagaceae bacterium]
MSYIQAVILAIIEGLTEFLPVSSTGHIMMGGAVMGLDLNDPFIQLFTVAIQLGTILSVVVLYFKRFFKSFEFYFKLAVATLPAAVLGLAFDDQIDAMLGNPAVVGISLILGGVILIFVDRWFKNAQEDNADNIPYLTALKIGFFQCLAMIPGVSRSAASIVGGMSQRLTRKAAAEFSFFLAVPTMVGATGKKMYSFFKNHGALNSEEVNLLIIGNVIGFIVAMFAIKAFIDFLSKKGFKVFGYYRIIIGVFFLIFVFSGTIKEEKKIVEDGITYTEQMDLKSSSTALQREFNNRF